MTPPTAISSLLLPLTAALTLGLGLLVDARAQDSALPDIGSSAGEVITPAQEAEYSGMLLRELRRMNMTLEDPLLDDWLQQMAFRLVAGSDRPRQSFTFFLLKDRQVNAFATLGGYVGMNTGLVLMAEREDEVAGVLGHEITHVTQRHVLRSVERAKKDSLPIALAMLGAILAASQSDSSSSGDATQAAILSGMSLMAQQQINYTRSNEQEADRIGIQTLANAGYDAGGMADMFGRMARIERVNTGGDSRYTTPDYLRTHPVTLARISEARERAKRVKGAVGRACILDRDGEEVRCSESAVGDSAFDGAAPLNPLLPSSLAAIGAAGKPGGDFGWARERMRVLSAESPAAAIAEYERMRRKQDKAFDDAERYGLALARTRMNQGRAALEQLQALMAEHPGDLWLELAMAEAEHQARRTGPARDRFERLAKTYPRNRAVALTYARVLGEIGTPEAGRRAQTLLRPLLASRGGDPVFQQRFARASELAGDLPRAGEAYAEAAFLNGRPEDALNQLEALKKRDDIDYYQRARIDARIAAITPVVLEMRRQGLRPGDQDRRPDTDPGFRVGVSGSSRADEQTGFGSESERWRRP